MRVNKQETKESQVQFPDFIMSEAGSSAIVTGGAQGLGAAICRALLKHGYKVSVADIQEEKGRQFVEEQRIEHGHDNVIFSLCDVTKEKDYERTFEETIKAFGRVDVLVNNAGIIAAPDPRDLIEVNVLGPIIGCHSAFKYMGKSNGGQGGIVINTASAIVFKACQAFPMYSTSKHAVLGLTRSYGLPYYLEKEGIMFTAICPGLLDTELTIKLRSQLVVSGMADFPLPDMLSPDYAAKGVLKILEDRINGSALLIPNSGGYIYVEPEDVIKK